MTKGARESWKKQVGRRLREERKRLGLGQQEIADSIQISNQLVSHWEHARSELTLYDLLRLKSSWD